MNCHNGYAHSAACIRQPVWRILVCHALSHIVSMPLLFQLRSIIRVFACLSVQSSNNIIGLKLSMLYVPCHFILQPTWLKIFSNTDSNRISICRNMRHGLWQTFCCVVFRQNAGAANSPGIISSIREKDWVM